MNRKELFDAAISRLKKAVIFNEVELDKFRDIGEQVEKLVKLKNLEDQDFEDAPDEFKVSLGRVISLTIFSRVPRDSTTRFVAPSVRSSLYFLGVFAVFGLTAPAQMMK